MNIIELKNIRKKLKISREDMANDLSISLETLNNWEYRTKEIPEDKINSIKYVYKTYFDCGSNDEYIEVETEEVESLPIKKIPFYDVDFYSGFTKIFNDQTVAPSYYFYLPEFHNAQFAIKNSGKSMSKELGNDDILGLREVPEWQTYFPQGEIYAVVTTNDLRTIKKVRRDKDNKYLVLIPKPLDEDKFDYPEYEEVPISMVTALFQVVASTHSKKLAL
ncbi:MULTISPECIES: S24 family peptidase [unclassified Empedobacter]|uniref:S24 family peptidase n=1 Tax=unclassified Empedobacter TaxID=2643773 RepID=UPI0025B83E4C|nr:MULTISPECIES: S24 family peptidase [unclassified Empedobacter]